MKQTPWTQCYVNVGETEVRAGYFYVSIQFAAFEICIQLLDSYVGCVYTIYKIDIVYTIYDVCTFLQSKTVLLESFVLQTPQCLHHNCHNDAQKA